MRRNQRLSATQILLWSTFGVGGGLLAGFALGEWVGGVNQTRVRRGSQEPGTARSPLHHTSAGVARAAAAALGAEPRSGGLRPRGGAVSRRSVELHGWVRDRARTGPAPPGWPAPSPAWKRSSTASWFAARTTGSSPAKLATDQSA